MNTTIQMVNAIIDGFDKEYAEWMDKKDSSEKEVMEIYKKKYNEFQDLYDIREIEDNSVEDKVILKILEWITFTVGEIYVDWNIDDIDYYKPGKSLKSIVEKFLQS